MCGTSDETIALNQQIKLSGRTETMRKRLTRIAPMRAGLVTAVVLWLEGVILVISGLATLGTSFLLGSGKSKPLGALGMIFLAVFGPLLYAAVGFAAGAIMAAFYNLAAKWTGGLEFDVADPSN